MYPAFLIAKKEIKVALREKLVLSLGIIVAVLLGVALYGGYTAYRQQHQAIEQARQQKRQEWLGQGEKHPHIAAHYGTYVFKPKTALSLLDFGLDAYTGTSVYLEAHHQHEFMFRPAQDHSSMIRFGELSAALVLQLLIPLLIIFLAFASFTRERERGTLKLLLSQGVSIGSIAWGKVLAYGLLLIALLLPFMLGVLGLQLLGVDSSSIPELGLRVLLLLLLYVLFLFVMITFSVWVSLHSSSGRNSLLSLLSCWVFFAIIMPKTLANLSEQLYPLPSMRQFKEAIQQHVRQGFDGKTTPAVRMARLEKEYLQKYGVDSVQQLPFNFEGVSMQAGEEWGNRVYDLHWERLCKLYHQQNRLSSQASFLNPFMALQHLSMGLAGTDLHSFLHFEQSAEGYRRKLVARMNGDMAENSRYGDFYGYKAGEDLWAQIEDFQYQVPGAWQMLRHYFLELLALLGWSLLTPLLLHYSTRKLKPTYA